VLAGKVIVGGEEISSIGKGLVVFAGIRKDDTEEDAEYLAAKTANLRVFDDADGRMNLNLEQAGGAILSIPQFTLFGRLNRGNRPSFDEAAPGENASLLWNEFNRKLRSRGIEVREGVFGAHMIIEMTHDGPVTLMLESAAKNPCGQQNPPAAE